jgi:hypothetical protein
MSKKDNTPLILIGGLAAAGGIAYVVMNKNKQQQAPRQQPVMYVQQPAHQTTPQHYPQQPSPAPTQPKKSLAEKASGILDLAKKGISVIGGLFKKKSVNGLGMTDEGYYYDQATNRVVITDESLLLEIQRQQQLNGLML